MWLGGFMGVCMGVCFHPSWFLVCVQEAKFAKFMLLMSLLAS